MADDYISGWKDVSGMCLNTSHQLFTQCLQGGFQSWEFGSVMWVKELTDLFFIGIKAICQFGVPGIDSPVAVNSLR